MSPRYIGAVFALAALAAGLAGARAAAPEKPAVSAEASNALQQMSHTLLAKDFSFKVKTIRVYQDESGDFLHIVHNLNVVVRRPDHLSVKATGDDGSTELLYNGKMATVFDASDKKYAQVAASGSLQEMLKTLADRLQVEFPLADFLTDEPGKSFLTGVTSGKQVNIVTVDGKPSRHLFFTQAGAIELELWLEKSDRAAPHRLIVTYRALPGQPSFIAEFSNWHFGIHPPNSTFAFQPPAGATKVNLARATHEVPEAKGEK